VVNGKIYAIGGGAGSSSSYSSVETFSTVEEYDPATNTWTRKADMPTARGFHSANVVDGKIYVIGGSPRAPFQGSVPTVEVYEPATDTWTRKNNMPSSRSAGFSSVVDGKIYCFGGYGRRRVDEYNPVTDTWTEKANMPTYRTALSTSVVDGKIYTIGGYIPGVSGYPGVTIVEVYDPATDTWTTAPDMPTGRFGPRTSVVDGKIYVIGGLVRWIVSASKAVEEYDPNPLVVDFNSDGVVDCTDMCMMIDHWHTDESLYDIAPTPLGDGIVDALDLLTLIEHLTEEKVDVEADIAAIEGVLDQYALAMETGDLDLWMSLYTDDTVKMLPDAPIIFGKEDLRAIMQPLFDNFTFEEMVLSDVEIQLAGHWAFSCLNFTVTMTPKAEGEPLYMDAKDLCIYERQADGSWKIARDCWNNNVPPTQ
jgi:uncharacterized protein (TIGR02246 family)